MRHSYVLLILLLLTASTAEAQISSRAGAPELDKKSFLQATLSPYSVLASEIARYQFDTVDPETGAFQTMWRWAYTYDALGRPRTVVWYMVDFTTGELSAVDSTIYAYQGEKLEHTITYVWEEGAWQPESQSFYEYDGDRLARVRTEERQDDGWVIDERDTYSYDGDRLTGVLTEAWANGSWVGDERETLEYSGGHIYRATSEEWVDGGWARDSRETYTEEGGTLVITYEEGMDGAWVNEARDLYEHIDLDDYEAAIGAFLDPAMLAFVFLFGQPTIDADEMTRNAQLNAYTGQIWDEFTQEWANEHRSTATVGSDGLLESTTDQDWDADFEEWTVSDSTLYFFEGGQIQRKEIWMPGFLDDDVELLEEEVYVYDGGELQQIEMYGFEEGTRELSGRYLLDWVDVGGGVSTEDQALPEGYRLDANYPNPFNPATAIRFSVGRSGPVTLTVHDALGRSVATLVDAAVPAGEHLVEFDATGLPSGVYIYRLSTSDGHTATRTMTLAK